MTTYEDCLLGILNRTSQERQANSSVAKKILSVDIYPEYTEVSYNGLTKTVDLESILPIISKNVTTKVEPTASIILPFGTFAVSYGKDSLSLSCYYPEQRRTLKYTNRNSHKTEEYSVPFPNLVITHTLSKQVEGNIKWSVYGSNFFVTPHSVLKLPTEIIRGRDASAGIFEMPFTNFYNGGAMCYGGNTMPVRHGDNLRGLDYYYQVIFDSPFNSDLGVKNFRTPKDHDFSYDPSTFYKWLSEQESFPYDRMK